MTHRQWHHQGPAPWLTAHSAGRLQPTALHQLQATQRIGKCPLQVPQLAYSSSDACLPSAVLQPAALVWVSSLKLGSAFLSMNFACYCLLCREGPSERSYSDQLQGLPGAILSSFLFRIEYFNPRGNCYIAEKYNMDQTSLSTIHKATTTFLQDPQIGRGLLA